VGIPVPKIYPFEALPFPHEKFSDLNEVKLFNIEVPIGIDAFPEFEVCFKEDRPTRRSMRFRGTKFLRTGLI
jgi:hypothetical protein